MLLLALPAWSQQPPPSDEQPTLQKELERRERDERQRRDRAEEVNKAYQLQLKNSASSPIPKVDPWGNVRDSGPTKQNARDKSSK
jgi:hypothetical protein